jgi:hypothetical protein
MSAKAHGLAFPRALLLVPLMVPLLLGFLAGCAPTPPDAGIPPGAWLVATGGRMDRLLAMLGTIERTPLAERATEARRRLGGCATVIGHLPVRPAQPDDGDPEAVVEGPDLFGALRCAEAEEVPPALAALAPVTGPADASGVPGLTFAVPLADGVRLVGFAALDDAGNVRLEARTMAPAGNHPLSLLLPGKKPAGTMLFHDQDALLHGRVLTDRGIDVAAWVPEGGGADRMFRLKSKLFSSFVLEGSWEVAVYLPLSGQAMPDVAVALGVKDQARAVEAMDTFLESLGENWPLRRTALSWEGGARAECLNNVQILPDLAPCWVALPEALVLGWNEQSLRRALYRNSAHEGVALQQGAALAIFLDRFPTADSALGQVLADTLPPEEPIHFPWRSLLIAGDKTEGLHRFRLQMVAEP